MTAAARLLILGIDGASPVLLERWIADGSLPCLAALAERGVTGRTRNVDGFHVGATWPSLCTGLTPARHGLHYTVQITPGSYEFYASVAKPLVTREPFWIHLSRRGQRVAVLDVPLSRLDPALSGMQVVEWGGHDAVFGFRASSSEIEAAIRTRFGEHPLGPSCDAVQRRLDDYADLVETLVSGVTVKAALTRHFLGRGGWDLFMQVFTEAHCAGHQCWHLHDASHPAHDAGIARALGDPLYRVYRAIDAAIGEIVEDAREARVVVLAAHGMAHWIGGHALLRDILFRLGVAAPPAAITAEKRPRTENLLRGVWRRMPSRARHALAPLRSAMRRPPQSLISAPRRTPALPAIGVDPAASACFVVPNGLAVSGIRLNLAGREPLGTLAPGAAADEFCGDLSAALLEIMDERTGAPLVRRVSRTSDLYRGECIDQLPDILIQWNDAIATGSINVGSGAGAVIRARSPRIGVLEHANDYGRTGEHRPGGWFVAAGPGIARGRIARDASLLDYAATFCTLLGVDPPATDGAAIGFA